MATSKQELEPLRFPVGRFDPSALPAASERSRLIDSIAAAPAALRAAVHGLTEQQLDTPYREGGWTVRQVVHHVPDSHLNAYIRYKWALTEDAPVIKTYDQTLWAELHDSRDTPIETSLTLLEALQDRWVHLMRAMSDDDFRRPLQHPEWGRIDLHLMTALYEWHGRHHVGHVLKLRERAGF